MDNNTEGSSKGSTYVMLVLFRVRESLIKVVTMAGRGREALVKMVVAVVIVGMSWGVRVIMFVTLPKVVAAMEVVLRIVSPGSVLPVLVRSLQRRDVRVLQFPGEQIVHMRVRDWAGGDGGSSPHGNDDRGREAHLVRCLCFLAFGVGSFCFDWFDGKGSEVVWCLRGGIN